MLWDVVPQAAAWWAAVAWLAAWCSQIGSVCRNVGLQVGHLKSGGSVDTLRSGRCRTPHSIFGSFASIVYVISRFRCQGAAWAISVRYRARVSFLEGRQILGMLSYN